MPVFAGDFAARRTEADRARTALAYEALEALGFQAVTLGDRDFLHGLDFLRDQIRARPGLFVSANVLDAKTSLPLAQTSVARAYEARRGRPAGSRALRVGITGYLSPALSRELDRALGEEAGRVRLLDPVEALRGVLGDLRKTSDVVILLAHDTLRGAVAAAEALPGFDLVVVGHASGAFQRKSKVKGATVVVNGEQGRFAAQAAVTLGAAGSVTVTTRLVTLDSAYPDHPDLARLRDRAPPDDAAACPPTAEKPADPPADERR